MIYANKEAVSFSVNNKNSAFVKRFLKECFEKIYLTVTQERLLEKSPDERFRELKNKELSLDIQEKEKNLLPIEDMVRYLSNANVVFKQSLDRIKENVVKTIEKKHHKKIKDLFDKQEDHYSKNKFYEEIFK